MINLLPPDTKKSVSYARRNYLLVRACFALIVIAVSVVVLFGVGHLYLNNQTQRYQTEITALQSSLKAQDLEGIKTDIQDLSGSVNLVLKVLASEILFSKILAQAATVMPAGSSLQELEITSDLKGIDISAGVDNYQVGTQVQINLADPNNKLFEKVDLIGVDCPEKPSGQYSCTAKLRGLFGDNSPYLFINNKAGQ